jgi:hypothetical protein
MFTAVAHKKLDSAEGYFVEHLSQNDYYAAGEIRPGQWVGIGAERLGLSVGLPVSRDQFCALCENRHPHTDEEALAHAVGHVLERQSVALEHELLAAAIVVPSGRTGFTKGEASNEAIA